VTRSQIEVAAFAAVRRSGREVLQILLGMIDNNVNFYNRKRESLLTYACVRVRAEAINFILELPDFRPSETDGIKTLAVCLRRASVSLLPKFLERPGFNMNGVIPKDINEGRQNDKREDEERYGAIGRTEIPAGVTLLTAALRLGRSEAVRLLLSTPGIDPSTKDQKGRSSLFDAALRLNSDFLQVLFHPKTNINEQDNDGNTVLMHAISVRALGAAEILINVGIDVSIKNHRGVLFLFSKLLGTSG
jgi:ankyrin repeat protein